VVAISVIAAVVVLLGAGVAYVYHQAGHYYSISPGSAPLVTANPACKSKGGSLSLPGGKPCVLLVIPADQTHPINGAIHMVDVLVGPTNPGDWLLSELGLLHRFRDGTVLVPASAILGNTPPSQLSCQGGQQMADATSAASVVAFRTLGYKVPEHDLGARVDLVQPGGPAAQAGVQCNDLITGVDGAAIRTADELVAAIRAHRPGEEIRLTIQRQSGDSVKTMELTARLGGTPAEGGSPANPGQAYLGIASQTKSTYVFPFPVSIQVGDIDGPSGGLALTLGMLDTLSDGQLTAGHAIAATGTMDVDGNVGDVGGVAQKAVAVRRAGAQVFFVPPQELAAAKSEAGSMKVYAVSTIQQALDILKSMGGELPPPTTTTTLAHAG
jgi:PDZ domain-containing protein